MRKTNLILFGILITLVSFGQYNLKYQSLINEAQRLYEKKDYLKSAQKFSNAFKVAGDSVIIHDRIAATSSWSQADLCDTAFTQLFIGKYGPESVELKSFRQVMKEKYSNNLIKVTKILDEQGWLGEDIIGHYGNRALFLVIQHSNLEAQKKYLPMMREAVKKGNANSSNLALLEDRVALALGKKQIYGTQLEYDKEKGALFVLPLEDPDNVEKRRAEIGLEKFEDYLSGFGIKWNPEEYKKTLPGFEAKQKK